MAILYFRGILHSIFEENDTAFTRGAVICFRDAMGLRIAQIAAALCVTDGSLSAYFEFLFKLIDIWTPCRPQCLWM